MQLFEVVLRATYQGQECVNKWNYVAPADVPNHLGAFTLLGALGFFQEGDPLEYPTTKLFYNVFHALVSGVAFTDVYAKNIYDPLDFYENPISPAQGGSQGSGAAQSPLVAFGFKTSRVRTDISRGTKRFAGVAGELLNAGGQINTTGTGLLAIIAAQMAATAEGDLDDVTYQFKPTIVSKKKGDGSPGHKGYEYYPDIETQSLHWAQNFSWSYYPQVRSQTSRQYGRGI
jgi:hypothetical protein